MEDIINASPEELILFLGEKSKNRIGNLSATASLLQKAARDSYRLDKCLYEPLNISLASSFNCIDAFKQEIKIIDKAIESVVDDSFEGDVYNLGMADGAVEVLLSDNLTDEVKATAQDAIDKIVSGELEVERDYTLRD